MGGNYSGVLGDGTTVTPTTPIELMGISDIVEISTGRTYTLAVSNSGEVYEWGTNHAGVTGDRPTSRTPVRVTEIADIATVSVANNTSSQTHVVALSKTGEVYAWGNNTQGQLGDGRTFQRNTPYRVGGETEPPISGDSAVLFNCEAGKEITLSLTGQNMANISDKTFTLTYDPAHLQVVDVAKQTPNKETTAGTYANIEFIAISNGTIRFKLLNRNVPNDSVWSGVLNIVQFAGLQNGTTQIALTY